MGKKILDDFRDFEVCGQTLKSQKYKYFENETFFLQIKTYWLFTLRLSDMVKKSFNRILPSRCDCSIYLISIVTQKTFLSFFKR